MNRPGHSAVTIAGNLFAIATFAFVISLVVLHLIIGDAP